MVAKLIKARELKRMRELEGVDGARRILTEALEDKALTIDNFSIRDLFVSLHENGEELLNSIMPNKSGGRTLFEAQNAVDTSAFSSITGQIIFNKIRDAYQDPVFLWPDLCETMQTEFLNGERIPGIGRIGDLAQPVGEGMIYPTVGLNEEYTDTVPTVKRGMVVPVTREIIIADRTGILARVAGEVGYWMGVNKEKRIIDLAVGNTNNYNRNGTATNTYLTAGAYINSQTGNALDGQANEWRAFEKSDLLFDAITDPNTGEPIIVMADTIIVPSALMRTAARILSATEVVTVDNRQNGATIRTASPNPYKGRSLKVLSSPYVKLRSGSSTLWWYGNPKKAFLYPEVWGIETTQAASNNEVEFMQDIWARYKVSERGAAQVLEPRAMIQNNQ